jgi:hypothetical protein
VRSPRPLPPARPITSFWAGGAYYSRPGHHWPRTAKGERGSVSEADNGLPYASSDQLARNLVQHTRLLAFSANAQKFLGLRRQEGGEGEGGLSRIPSGVKPTAGQ